jgi:hypothetical protein
MKLRTFSWLGRSLVITLVFLALGAWYLYSQRLVLDEENRRELAHAAHDLGTILSDLSSTADEFFPRERCAKSSVVSPLSPPGSIVEFTRQNPYLAQVHEDLHAKKCGSELNAGLIDPFKLALPWFDKTEFKIKTETIFDAVAISDAFEYLLVADGSGKVTFSMDHGASSLRRENRGWLERQAEENTERRHPTIQIKDLAGLEISDKNFQSVASAASGSRPIRLGEKEYQLYYYPLEITALSKGADGKVSSEKAIWILGGLVDPLRMWREAMMISPQWTFLFFVFILLAVAGQPFLKLFLLSPRERFGLGDACLLLPSATFLLMLITTLLLDASTYGRLKSLASGGLEALAQKVEEGFTRELHEMRDQLVQYDTHLTKDSSLSKCSDEEVDVDNLLKKPDEALAVPSIYRDFSQVAWVHDSGRQFFKATVHPNNTPRVKVDRRPYFTEPRDRHLWSFNGDENNGFFVQSFRSFTTGDLFTALSMRSALKCTKKENDQNMTDKVVAVMSGHLMSFERPLVGLGYGFGIVGPDGLVLYHSDRRRTLKENLFEEVNDPERLYAAMKGGTPQHFYTTYSRSRIEMFIRPLGSIAEAHWSLVAFRDQQLIDTVNNEVLLRAILWSLIPLGGLLLLCLALRFLGRRQLGLWWPDPKRFALYRTLAIGYAATFLFGLTIVVVLKDHSLFVWSLAFPLLAAILTVLVAALDGLPSKKVIDGEAGSTSCPYRRWYFLAVGALWANISVVPSAGLFRHSWTLEMAKLTHLESERAVKQTKDWVAQDENWVTQKQQIAIPDGELGRDFLRNRQRYLESYGVVLTEPGRGMSLDRTLDRHLPLYNKTAVLLRYQYPHVRTALTSSSQPLDYKVVDAVFGWEAIVGAILTSLMAWWWLGYKDRHLLWSRLAERLPAPEPAQLLATDRLVIFLTPSERERARVASLLRERPKAAAATADGAPRIIVENASDSLTIVDDFELLLATRERRIETLEQLEKTVEMTGRAAIISHSEPLSLLHEKGHDYAISKTWGSLPPAERQRWIRVIDRFAVHVTAVDEPAEGGELVEGSQEIEGSPSSPSPAEAADPQNRNTYAESLWRYCSREERLTLVHVAEEGFANPHQAAAVERLVEKGLLVLRPNLMLMNSSFEAFVLQRAVSPEVKSWEQADPAMGWHGVRWIFLIVIVATLVFLAVTQESWIKSTSGMLIAMAGALEGVWELLRAVQRYSRAWNSR